jgi:hypothetical protein
MGFVIIVGTVMGPYKLVGPFTRKKTAEDFAAGQEQTMNYESWGIIPLTAPQDEDDSWQSE